MRLYANKKRRFYDSSETKELLPAQQGSRDLRSLRQGQSENRSALQTMWETEQRAELNSVLQEPSRNAKSTLGGAESWQSMTPEGYVKKAVEDLLKAERIRYWRMNAGDRFGSTKGRKWRIRGHESGTPDFLASLILRNGADYPDAALVWIECKAPGKLLTTEQLRFADEARNNREYALTVDDVRQLAGWLKENRAR